MFSKQVLCNTQQCEIQSEIFAYEEITKLHKKYTKDANVKMILPDMY